ncbi:sodium-dependent dicarboxylate transporter 2/3/5 [Natronospira proteinivora]|uniref:Sodium-dependent dicarboxylate transporter 2/3/5 n=1 Tax=Natronospira proteinivora TaxID=1807133 RepID=A0ABT1G6H8_9GAMM|nr:DASS family sodium-coupled anion symporter [Natronospira proteinivora]MCP1726550.1 sodium-dependent dicarboxylate transporter 2/3/5 [Natronospira proteinivora]
MAKRFRRALKLALGPAAFLITLLTPAPLGLDTAAWLVCGLAAWMMIWWIGEVLPLAVTALLPVLVLPLSGVVSLSAATAPYANPVVFLFLGGFLLALAIQSSGLHRRMAHKVVALGGARLDYLVAAVMAATAVLSMWISNTAAAAILLPIALSILALARQGEASQPKDPLAPALLIGVAFAANIGGMATLIGTPPNAILAAYLGEQYDIHVSFAGWMMVALPISLVLLALAWWTLVRVCFPVGQIPVAGLAERFAEQRRELGPWRVSEKRVAGVFLLAVLAWMFRPLLEGLLPGIDDAIIALAAAMLLFILPSGDAAMPRLLDWEQTRNLPWGVLILIGGGLSLGIAVQETGLADAIAEGLKDLSDQPLVILVVLVAVIAMLVSHVTSNTAAAATLIPVVAAVAASIEVSPLILAMPVALAASCAFMLPNATPPNAIVFGSNRLRVPQMLKAGAVLSGLSIALMLLVGLILYQF